MEFPIGAGPCRVILRKPCIVAGGKEPAHLCQILRGGVLGGQAGSLGVQAKPDFHDVFLRVLEVKAREKATLSLA